MEESGVVAGTGEPKLTVIVCDDYLDTRLAEVNRRHLEAKTPWTLVRPHGMEALFGPTFRADNEGPCWDCLAHRLRSHREVHSFLRNIAGEEAAFKPFATSPRRWKPYGLAAAEIVKWLVLDQAGGGGGGAPIHDHVIAMNVGTFASSQHRVMRRPQCLACGDEALHRPDRQPVPLSLRASRRLIAIAAECAPRLPKRRWRNIATWSARSVAL